MTEHRHRIWKVPRGQVPEVPGPRFQVPGSRSQVPGARCQGPGPRFPVRSCSGEASAAGTNSQRLTSLYRIHLARSFAQSSAASRGYPFATSLSLTGMSLIVYSSKKDAP